VADDCWDPEQYERFRAERTAPFVDLLALVRPRPGMRIVDLGCGTGELTQRLHRSLQARETLGVDASPAMLDKSAAFAGEGLRFARGDIAAFADEGTWDLVFSNAALHWVPDHAGLLARLSAALAPGGQLAVQVPANFDHPTHTIAAAIAAEPPFRDALGAGADPPGVLRPEEYAVLLAGLGHRTQHVRLQVYGHELGSREEVVEWVKGSLLTAYRRGLPPELWETFLARYRARLLPALDDRRPYFYPFKRILFWTAR
jgi:trans-aconitate 2-methyltransferase